MKHENEVLHTLNRLLAVQWKPEFARFKSHKILLIEYFRRSALWAKTLNATSEWPILDIALHIDPTIRAAETVLKIWHEHLARLGENHHVPREMEYLLECALYWATTKDRLLTQSFDLPEPYEPIILMYERGGFFYRSHEGIDITSVTAISRMNWQAYDRDTPYDSLEISELDRIDSEDSYTI